MVPPQTGMGLDLLEFQVTIVISDALLHSFCRLLVLLLVMLWWVLEMPFEVPVKIREVTGVAYMLN